MRWLSPDIPVGTALVEALGRAPAMQAIADAFREGPAHLGLLGLRASACTVAAAYLARRAVEEKRGPLVYLIPDASSLEDAREDFAFLLGSEHITHFPESGALPYGQQIPPASIRAARIETLARLALEDEGVWVVLTTPEALFRRIPHRRHFSRFLRRVRVGEQLEMNDLMELLVRMGYQAETLVGEYGDFSQRGGIVDVYTYGRVNPVRIEFDDNEIVSLREFDVFTQRSLAVLSDLMILPLW